MSKIDVLKPEEMGSLLGLLVHDLRNPSATITANVDFLQEVGLSDEESTEALDDVKLAVGELRRGLDLLAWISRWLSGQMPLEGANGDVGIFVKRIERETTPVPVTVHVQAGEPLHASGAQVAVEVLSILLHNTRANLPDGSAEIAVSNEGDWVLIKFQDAGEPIGKDLRQIAFTMAGQGSLKGRADGRYSRFVGLFAAAVALNSVGGSIEASDDAGKATFTIRLRKATSTHAPKP